MITDNYIKQCEKAEEIQKLKKGKSQLNNQDLVAYNFGLGLQSYICAEISRFWTIQDLIWLPTQEQLQEMIGVYDVLISTKVINDILMIKNNFRSISELLLAYVMKFEYNKFWTGDNWVKDNNYKEGNE